MLGNLEQIRKWKMQNRWPKVCYRSQTEKSQLLQSGRDEAGVLSPDVFDFGWRTSGRLLRMA
jgi:hypothetical protein